MLQVAFSTFKNDRRHFYGFWAGSKANENFQNVVLIDLRIL
jgi:hypothetical protein